MTYTSNIPLAGDLLSVSQGTMNANFTYLQSFLQVDHENVNTANFGKHRAIRFPTNVAPATDLTDVGLYQKADALGVLSLFIRKENNGAEQQLTGNVSLPSVSPFAGETVIFGGLRIKYGNVSIINSGAGTTTLFANLGLANFVSSCFGVLVTVNGGGSGNTVVVTASGTTGFTAKTGTTANCFFLALGV